MKTHSYNFAVKPVKYFVKGNLKGIIHNTNLVPFVSVEECHNWIDQVSYSCKWEDVFDFDLLSAEIIDLSNGKTISRTVIKCL